MVGTGRCIALINAWNAPSTGYCNYPYCLSMSIRQSQSSVYTTSATRSPISIYLELFVYWFIILFIIRPS